MDRRRSCVLSTNCRNAETMDRPEPEIYKNNIPRAYPDNRLLLWRFTGTMLPYPESIKITMMRPHQPHAQCNPWSRSQALHRRAP
ncbi:LOW QUALITY PROTEIN: hypothetical protein SPRG_05455 [Saprolegnia parasitica CBS 223.65]|uniref:Uncharacterized protein n=1 Tax=Saprolegnia parasitica (strain CBS 223.65) TaxID=695850 RepID=A0A067CJC7_SAPPC|nr:LOW QUALITY PROTEIN: hypothetical protein SPRG_05455 [Saprolegnia parasitica CBS 223.65]KDO29275.1 LOW QUALITY PROTEIN: hypothetical protein SPRG_05455 [Saprolegnia parasitica CBS 223.65]|eukprot:XP_012200089.1 LOW QUALITY PROTEIN: hypothetical protein SPRG_05455 [Saprolegnia parasitica CBS 223.65]